MVASHIPIVIGVGDIKNRSLRVEDAKEPLELMLQATRVAFHDATLSKAAAAELQSNIDHIGVVNTWTWQYSDLPSLLSEKLGVDARYKFLSHHGGDSPAKLFDEAARRISLGQSKVAVVTGGEALASLEACAAAKKMPPRGWSKPVKLGKQIDLSDVSRYGKNVGTRHSFGLPIHVYPLYENGFRSHRGQSMDDNNLESAKLYADFAQIAAKIPIAWNYGEPAATVNELRTVNKKNRMICYPYPLLMNAFNNVNLAATCILTSTEYAKELGIPKDRWIYPLGGAGTSDSSNFWQRPNYHSSPSLERSLDTALEISGVRTHDIDLFDFYSCFPIVPKLACEHLRLPILNFSKPISLLGGLTSFGGAGNNYSMHALTEMVRQLRTGKYRNGLVLANGGTLTHQYVVCLSSIPRSSPYPEQNPLPELLNDESVPAVDDEAEGEAVIETYTVEFGRDGNPSKGFIVGRLRNGNRFLANHGSQGTLNELSAGTKEHIGRSGWVRPSSDGERNLFFFENLEKL